MSSGSENGKIQGRGRSNSLPTHVVDYLKGWLMSPDHINHPYPTEKEKAEMVADTGIDLKRLNNWFVNNRIRFWKPRMEALQKKRKLEIEAAKDNMKVPTTTLTVETSSPMSGKLISSLSQALHAQNSAASFVSDMSGNNSTSSEDGSVSDAQSEEATVNEDSRAPTTPQSGTNSNLKRKFAETNDMFHSPRSKYSQKNVHLWRAVCMTSPKLNDVTLPSLDEAACLFGYASDQ